MTVAMVVLGCAEDTPKSLDAPAAVVGEEPTIKRYISQADIEAGKFTLDELVEHGRDIFIAPFNTLDGAGRPEQTGKGGQRRRRVVPTTSTASPRRTPTPAWPATTFPPSVAAATTR